MSDDFYASLPVVADFALAVRPESYAPLPDDWMIGFSDVTGSTAAVAKGRYKAVNMLGAGVIAAVANALQRKPFPFVFGGDGASFAVGPDDAGQARAALSATATLASEEFDLELRVAATTVAEIRAAGRDIRVARYGASPFCAYAMFGGGGLTWFDGEAKKGRFALTPAPPGTRPDLTDLSCRWGVAPAKHGVILSVIAAPRGDDPRFPGFVAEIVETVLQTADGGRPITLESLIGGKAGPAIALESVVMSRPGQWRGKAWLQAGAFYALGRLFKTFKLPLGPVPFAQYQGDVAANADFRKFDDGLRMTLDCSPAFADALEAKLAAADEFAEYGAFRQDSAQITCYAPSIVDRSHLHFVDGAGGGYTMAAKAMKARRGTQAA